MPSSNKTTKLKLNKFVGSDRPKMDDVNYDNDRLESLIAPHLDSLTAHLTSTERADLFKSRILFVTYLGTGVSSATDYVRTIQLPFDPKFGVIFTLNSGILMGFVEDLQPHFHNVGLFGSMGCTAGLELTGRNLKVKQEVEPTSLYPVQFNSASTVYACVCFR